MANKNITVMLDMLMNTSNVNSGIGQIRQQLKTLKLPSNLQDSFRKSFSDLDDGVSKIQRRLSSGFKTKSDVTGLEKELKNVDNIITNIIKDYNKIGESTINKSLKLENLDEFKELQILLADINKELSAQKETTAFKKVTQDIQELNKITKANALKQFTQAIDTGNIEEASKALEILKQRVVDPTSQKLYFGNSEKQREYNQLVAQLEQSFNILATGEIQSVSQRLSEINNRLDNLKSKAFTELSKVTDLTRDDFDKITHYYEEKKFGWKFIKCCNIKENGKECGKWERVTKKGRTPKYCKHCSYEIKKKSIALSNKKRRDNNDNI